MEHWVVAERQGQTAARNMLGRRERFDSVPFFWSAHYDVTIAYVGHAERWDRIDVDGDLGAGDASVSYWQRGQLLALATVGRDRESLTTEARLEGIGSERWEWQAQTRWGASCAGGVLARAGGFAVGSRWVRWVRGGLAVGWRWVRGGLALVAGLRNGNLVNKFTRLRGAPRSSPLQCWTSTALEASRHAV